MVNKDFFLALDAIEREKGIDKELIINALEKALASAYNKNYGEEIMREVNTNGR